MTLLRPGVQVLVRAVLDGRHGLAVGRAVGTELVGDHHLRHRASPLEQLTEEALGDSGVPPVPDQDVEHVALLVDGPPQVLPLAVDEIVQGLEINEFSRARIDASVKEREAVLSLDLI